MAQRVLFRSMEESIMTRAMDADEDKRTTLKVDAPCSCPVPASQRPTARPLDSLTQVSDAGWIQEILSEI
jgi:hypothetical protein